MVYDVIERICAVWVRLWGRLTVVGLEHVPPTGPVLVVPNHDSQMDPVVASVAIFPRRRLTFLARANLWSIPLLGPIMDAMGQIPIRRGVGDNSALDRAAEALQAGAAVGVFPEGRLSWGVRTRARSGVGVLASRCPEATVVLCTIEGATDFVRFPRRPRVRVTFSPPAAGGMWPGETPSAFAARLVEELRTRVPVTAAGRKALVGGPPRIQRRLDAERHERERRERARRDAAQPSDTNR